MTVYNPLNPETPTPDDAQPTETPGEVGLKYQGERRVRYHVLLDPEREAMILRAKVVRYSELVGTTLLGLTFCAAVEREWLLAVVLFVLMCGAFFVSWNTREKPKKPPKIQTLGLNQR